jgi:ribosome biogenesis protein ERB1
LLKAIRKIRAGKTVDGLIDPYQSIRPKIERQAISAAPAPKRRFQPSKTERIKIAKIANAIARGWINLDPKPKKEEIVYDLWGDEGISDVPGPPREELPGHEESYNPPEEYGANPPDCLRKLPGYKHSI